jgi:hypothetical protein
MNSFSINYIFYYFVEFSNFWKKNITCAKKLIILNKINKRQVFDYQIWTAQFGSYIPKINKLKKKKTYFDDFVSKYLWENWDGCNIFE